GCVAGSLMTPITNMEVLKSFYKNVRPWGFWGPVLNEVLKDDPSFEHNKDFGRDMLNVVIGTIAQTAVTALPVFIVLLKPQQSIVSAIVLLMCILILYKTWYRKLPTD
ncbi:MAG TPA: sodium:solute symporter, partial [Emticicia sp.]